MVYDISWAVQIWTNLKALYYIGFDSLCLLMKAFKFEIIFKK